jgi:hypothetical protein
MLTIDFDDALEEENCHNAKCFHPCMEKFFSFHNCLNYQHVSCLQMNLSYDCQYQAHESDE